ncbi:2,3-bisphosphoglycerate-dependent phosphoglycerate mutase [Sediminitomix flava]|uniref:2,3-bisphosphoglycerate-dependent phosphoglycerate mutase n=1 Tax=Sediminitomix flava TaxID=379075 RepID=A0A315ZE60_SEDFL|nr:2,3-bisphosphoglycerate-dependent phosphoglycerate mutase [Sediminitomix flava]PWJ43855.1 phosphoglycerate mutase [Sediminitomix flava]
MAKLILIRHGQSMWNIKNVFTGWVDVPLSANGISEAIEAGKQLADINFDVVYTSMQIRALETAMIALAQNNSDKTPILLHTEAKLKEWTTIYDDEMKKNMIPVHHNWHLNERYYGELQGKNKTKTAEEFGEEQVHLWRRSYDVPPPNGESLEDTAKRTIPFFKESVIPELKTDKNVLISAHGNSLRSIVMYIENLSKEEIVQLEIPTGKPILYEYEEDKLIRI